MAAVASGSRGKRWLIGESDFGGPIVEHVHPEGSAVAYVLLGQNGREYAQCTECGERKTIAERREELITPAH
jgi:hypothetical protein